VVLHAGKKLVLHTPIRTLTLGTAVPDETVQSKQLHKEGAIKKLILPKASNPKHVLGNKATTLGTSH
jgi:hypothetical protein